MFNKILKPKRNESSIKLADIVNKSSHTGYIFGDIMNDLGESVEIIMQNEKSLQMAYGYARRSSATALYLQGIIDSDGYDHNLAFFKAIQINTGHTVEFQEQAFTDAIEFMQTYNFIITRLLLKQMAAQATNFTQAQDKLSDLEFIEIVLKAYTN
jgi:hypothetical protein